MRFTRQKGAVLLYAILAAQLSAAASAAPWIDMGAKDDFAFDQPHVSFELFANDGSGTSLGPHGDGFFGLINQFLLDTGATSIIAMNDAESDLRDNGYVTVNTVLEQGVAGFSVLDVSAPYLVEVSGNAGGTATLPNVRIMSGQFPDLFSVNGVVGMPGMVGRVVSLDETVWAGIETFEDLLDADPLGVSFSGASPASNGHRYSAPIRAKRFDVTGDPPLPTASPIPLIDMSVGFAGLDAAGTFVVDTGAAISFISTEIATQIGLDSNMDGVLGPGDEQFEDTLPIGGIGGTIDAPVFLIDRFSVATDQGIDLVWNLESLLSVLVVDIHPDIDGVLGSDLLTSGWIDLLAIILGEGDASPGPLEYVHFDFRQFFEEDDVGTIYFDLSPSFDVVQPGLIAGDYNRDGSVDAADYVLWRNTEGATGSGLAADGNGDQVVNEADYGMWRSNFGKTQAAAGSGILTAGVPEPRASLLLLMGALVGGSFAALSARGRRQARPRSR